MVMLVVSPRKSIGDRLFQRVGGGEGSCGKKQKRCSSGYLQDEETVELSQIGVERTKNVLILMSDTGGGHRASAEAIRDAFRLEFGHEYRLLDLERRGDPAHQRSKLEM